MRSRGFALAAALLLGAAVFASPARAVIYSGDLYYTLYGPGTVNTVHYTYDNSVPGLTLGPQTFVAAPRGADGIIFAPNGNLLVANQGSGAVSEITTGGTIVNVKASNLPGGSYHLALSPDGSTVYSMGTEGGGTGVSTLAIPPLTAGVAHSVSYAGAPPAGSVGAGVTSIAFVGNQAYYTYSGSGGTGDFGTIDLTTFKLTPLITNVVAAHGLNYDPFTGHLILFGGNQVAQIDPATPTAILSSQTFAGAQFDQGAPDGQGHLFAADNNGKLLFLDYSGSGQVGSTSYDYFQFFASTLDDLAPLAGPGAQGPGATPEPVTAGLSVMGLSALGLTVLRRRCGCH